MKHFAAYYEAKVAPNRWSNFLTFLNLCREDLGINRESRFYTGKSSDTKEAAEGWGDMDKCSLYLVC